MKNPKRLVCLALTALMLLGNVFTAGATQTNEFEYLRGAIQTIDAVPSEKINQYIENNREWIDEIGVRLESYLETFPEEKQNGMVTLLLSSNSTALRANLSGNLDDYFNSVIYHLRGGYWTYSLNPKWSVRLWGPTMEAAWTELGNNYSGIRNDNGSLWNQYRCHWDYDVLGILAGDWDLEEGRPLVPYSDMFAALCNP